MFLYIVYWELYQSTGWKYSCCHKSCYHAVTNINYNLYQWKSGVHGKKLILLNDSLVEYKNTTYQKIRSIIISTPLLHAYLRNGKNVIYEFHGYIFFIYLCSFGFGRAVCLFHIIVLEFYSYNFVILKLPFMYFVLTFLTENLDENTRASASLVTMLRFRHTFRTTCISWTQIFLVKDLLLWHSSFM